MRKPAALLVGLAAMAVLSGCVGHPPDTSAADLQESSTPDSEVTLRLAHAYDTGHPVHTCGAEPLRERLAKSGINVEVFPAAQLGNEEQTLQLLRTHNLEMTVAGPAFLGAWYEPAEVFDAAYAFRDVDHFDSVTNGEIGREVWEGLREDSGLRVLSSWYYGTRHTTANHPVRGPGDIRAEKLRVPSAPVYLDNTEAMGGTATPMALGEVYLGLQQGVIDAQENPLPTIQTSRFDEAQSHLSLTGHVVQGVMPVIDDSVYADLSRAQRAALTDATRDLATDVRACVARQESAILEDWREAGEPRIVERGDIATDAFATRARAILPRKNKEWGALYRRIQDTGRAPR